MLAYKLLLTPLLIGAVSLAGRRWGPSVSGWLVGLPLSSGPVVFFFALEQGNRFASTAASLSFYLQQLLPGCPPLGQPCNGFPRGGPSGAVPRGCDDRTNAALR